MKIEHLVLASLIKREEYARKVLAFIDFNLKIENISIIQDDSKTEKYS